MIPDWISLDTTTGQGNAEVNLSCTTNNGNQAREATLVVSSSSGSEVQVNIIQDTPGVSLSFDLGYAGFNKTVSYDVTTTSHEITTNASSFIIFFQNQYSKPNPGPIEIKVWYRNNKYIDPEDTWKPSGEPVETGNSTYPLHIYSGTDYGKSYQYRLKVDLSIPVNDSAENKVYNVFIQGLVDDVWDGDESKINPFGSSIRVTQKAKPA